MVNTRYNIPRKLKLRCKYGSQPLQYFYRQHFVDDYGAFRDGTDVSMLNALEPDELQIAKELTELNLEHRHILEANRLISEITSNE